MIGFSQFCKLIENELLRFLPKNYRDENYKVMVCEKKDAYQMATTCVYLEDGKKRAGEVPTISLDVAYENLKRIKDTEKVMKMVAETYDKQYKTYLMEEDERYRAVQGIDMDTVFVRYITENEATENEKNGIYVMRHGEKYAEYHVLLSDTADAYLSKRVTTDERGKCNINDEELHQVALKNAARLLPLSIYAENGSDEQKTTDVFCIKKPEAISWESYGEDIYDELAEKASNDLLVVSINADEKLLVPAQSIECFTETKEILKEMESNGECAIGEVSLYDKQDKKFITDSDVIESMLGQKERRTKSVFNR